jgi:hypothetical protein
LEQFNEPSKMAAECSTGREPGVTIEKEITKPSKRATENTKGITVSPGDLFFD